MSESEYNTLDIVTSIRDDDYEKLHMVITDRVEPPPMPTDNSENDKS